MLAPPMDGDFYSFSRLFNKYSLDICYDAETKADTEAARWVLNE